MDLLHIKKFTSLFITFIVLFSSCYVAQNPQTSPENQPLINFANMYNPKATTVFPKFVVYNENDSTTIIYNYIYLPQLLFRKMPNNQYQAKIFLNYKATPSFLNRTIIDTLSKILVIKQNNAQKNLTFPVKLHTIDDTTFLITAYLKDMYRRRANIAFLYVDRSSPNRATNFLIRYADDFRPVFGNAIYPQYRYLVSHNSDSDSLFVFYYKPDTLLPKPPFYLGGRTKKIYADTVFKIAANKPVSFEKQGIYLFSLSRNDLHGKAMVYFNDDFPIIAKASEMIPPLAYITTSQEYNKLRQAYSPKLAVDSFWLDIAEDPDKARELIKIYYNRVFLANVYFTSYKPGWQTDRGMIYIMFGLPQIVHKLDNAEIWYYYDYKNGTYVSFKFIWQHHPLSDNVYILKPQTSYRYYWKKAVKQWRNGNIPSF